MKYKIIVDKQTQGNPSPDKREYEIDIEELRVKGDVYDSLIITQEEDYVIRRLKLSEYNVLSVLPEPIKEPIPNLNIELFEGDNYIYLADMTGNRFYAEYLIKNDFNNTFATRIEMNTAITQTAQNIELSVNKKLEGYSTTEEMNSAITISADSINNEVKKKVGKDEIVSSINQSAEEVQINANKISLEGKEINLTSDDINIASTNFNVDKDGNMNCKNANITGGSIELTNEAGDEQPNPKLLIYEEGNRNNFFRMSSRWITGQRDLSTVNIALFSNSALMGISAGTKNITMGTSTDSADFTITDGINNTRLYPDRIETPKLNQTSLERIKKNIQKYEKNASEIIKNSDIYEYNLKSEKDTDKKQIGFIIGDNYRTPDEVINQENNAIVLYSAIGLLWKSNQEQQEEIELLKNKISELEAKING